MGGKVDIYDPSLLRPESEWGGTETYKELLRSVVERRRKGWGRRPSRPKPAELPPSEGQRQYLLDKIMENAYSGESLKMSLARLAMAAGTLGYLVLYPHAVRMTYKHFPHLTERKYNGRRNQDRPAN